MPVDKKASALTPATTPLSGNEFFAGVQGGNDVQMAASDIALTLANTAVTPATYGDATHVGQFTVDAKGRLTGAANVAISGGGGGMAIGDPVTGGAEGSIPFIDASGNLAQDNAHLQFFPNGLGAGQPYLFFGSMFMDADGLWFAANSDGNSGLGGSNNEGTGNGDGTTTIEFGRNSGHLNVGKTSSPSVSAGDSVEGTDLAGEITIGAGHTGTTMTFADPYQNNFADPKPPFCVVTNQSGTVVIYSISDTAITISGCLAGDILNYICVGRQSAA